MSNRVNPTYLGEVVSVSGASVTVRLTPQVKSGLLMIEGRAHRIGQVGSFIRIPQGYNDLYGVISETGESEGSNNSGNDNWDRRVVKVELVGEGIGDEFERGISQFPSIRDEAHLVTETDLRRIYGNNEDGQVLVGKLSSADSISVGVNLDSLVNRHSAILGSTGSGKSTSVSSLLRSIVSNDQDVIIKPSARIVLFDIHGEYSSALRDVSSVFSINPSGDEKDLVIPYWCISPDKLVDFLCGGHEGVKNKFLDLVVVEKQEFIVSNNIKMDPHKVTPYTPVPYRIKKIWYDLYHEDNVNWNEKQKLTPAYLSEGDFETLEAPTFRPPNTSNESLSVKGGPQVWKKQLELMRSRLLDAQFSFCLSPGPWTPDRENQVERGLADLISDWIGDKSPITILDLSGMPEARLDLLLGSMLDILFEAAVWGRRFSGGMKDLPLLLVMEEAHRYLGNESNGVSKDMVRRIAKEGRKFGVGAMLVSQRPSEIDETILSQCGTLMALRINNAADRNRVKSAMSDGLSGIVDSLPVLRTGEAILTGEAVTLPMRCRFKVPKDGRYPDSKDPEVSKSWARDYKEVDFSVLVDSWVTQILNNK
ncbi:ATP-binding protein [Marinobacter shengliensis]|uniref:ATP-binding protein n=1 Tax=Marinobacter shengliensis TaxID=1389223 RepID=UPI000D0E7E63|nr:ATP-binding protein [Marinobacter shengliensis]PSF12620.1 ATPase [Marinobacter shengliensis]